MEERSLQSEISSYIGKLLRDNFGKGPASVYVTIQKPYVTIYLKDFLAPMEKLLVGQNNKDKVEETRDLLMQELIPDIKATFRATAGLELNSLYYDWSLTNRSGMIIGVIQSDEELDPSVKDYQHKAALHEEIKKVSKQAEKIPEEVSSFKINDRTIVVERNGILVAIEKEMIRSGFGEQLRMAKRHLEKRLLHQLSLEKILQLKVEDIFVDWDFDSDFSHIILIVKPES
ncbi:Na-translocating system protein MpsC family protein [Halobacillus sp. B29]|uniref:Na-translocating system protein MpsC family protein n=1 Tax=Halobacillus sp. B29 TaxID=3457432 RepID=UPI003FCE843C